MSFSNNKWFNFFAFKEARLFLTIIFICLLVAAFLGAKTPLLITDLSKNYDSNLFKNSVYLLFLNFSFVYINRVTYQLLVNKYVRLLIQNARSNTYKRWLKAHELEVDKYPQGEILSRIMSDTEAIRELVTSGAFGIFIDLTFVLSCLYGLIKVHQFSGIFLSVSEILVSFLLFAGSGLMRDMFMRLRNSQAKVNRVTANIMGGFSQIYYTNHQNYALKKSTSSFDEFLANQHKANSMDAFYYAIAESMYPILLALLVIIFPYGHITEAAMIFAIVDLIQRSINPIKEISGKIANIQRARVGIERITQFLEDTKIRHEEKELIKNLEFEKIEVAIKNFTYKNSKGNQAFSLNDISFQGKKGDLIGIVGLSGSGKSTLLNILSGNLKIENEEVNIVFKNNKINIEDYNNYQRQVSLVSQESHLFSDTLKFNITLSDEDSEFEKRFIDFQNQIPYLKKWGIKADDIVDPKQLSLGQKQLLAGIRALYLKKNIVFFDEISSALDPELELALRNMINLIQSNSLTITVAHRIETIMNSSNILVMGNGRIIQSGIHDELLKNCETYRKFIQELSHS